MKFVSRISVKPGTRTLLFRSALLTLILASASLRLVAISFDLPFMYDVDEHYYSNTAVRILASFDPDPQVYGAPGHFTIYLLAVAYAVYVFIQIGIGNFDNIYDLGQYWIDTAPFYLVGRFTIVIFSIGIVLVTYVVARTFLSRQNALIATLLVSISPLLVDFAFFIRPDNDLTFFVLLGFLFTIKVFETGRLKYYVASGICLGLAVISKWPGAVFALTICAAHLLRDPKTWWPDFPRLLAAAFASLITAFIFAPFLFLEFPKVLADVLLQAREFHTSATSTGPLSSLLWYVQHVFLENFSIVGVGLVLFAGVFAIKEKNRHACLLLIFATSFLGFMLLLNLRWARWLIPLIPFISIMFAYGFASLIKELARIMPKPVVAAGTVLVFVAVVGPVTASTIELLATRLGDDTRTLSQQWITENIPAGSRLLVEVYTAQLPNHMYKIFIVFKDRKITERKTLGKYIVPQGSIANLEDLTKFSEYKFDYILISNLYDRAVSELTRFTKANEARLEREIQNLKRAIEVYEKNIMQSSDLVYEIAPIPGRRGGPIQRIYRVRR